MRIEKPKPEIPVIEAICIIEGILESEYPTLHHGKPSCDVRDLKNSNDIQKKGKEKIAMVGEIFLTFEIRRATNPQ